MRLFRIETAALALAIVASPAWADAAGRYETKDTTPTIDMEMTIEADDAGNVRMQMAGQPFYYLLTGGQLYSVSRGSSGPVVARLTDVLAMQEEALKRIGRSDILSGTAATIPAMDFVAMGPEKVGPWQGTAYGIKSDSGKPGPYAAFVLSDDSRLAPLGRGLIAVQRSMLGRMASIMPAFGQLGQGFMRLLSKGTPIRMATFELTDVSVDPIDPDRFALPAPPESLDQMRAQAEPFPAPPTLPPRKKAP